MYESPIEVIYGQVHSQMVADMENRIYQTVRELGVDVDKEELLRALKYDRDQYKKGFEDGYRRKEEELMGLNDVE